MVLYSVEVTMINDDIVTEHHIADNENELIDMMDQNSVIKSYSYEKVNLPYMTV